MISSERFFLLMCVVAHPSVVHTLFGGSSPFSLIFLQVAVFLTLAAAYFGYFHRNREPQHTHTHTLHHDIHLSKLCTLRHIMKPKANTTHKHLNHSPLKARGHWATILQASITYTHTLSCASPADLFSAFYADTKKSTTITILAQCIFICFCFSFF